MPATRILIALIALTAIPALVSVGAQAQQEPPPPFCENDARFKAFDFWVGDWNAYDSKTGELAGTNTIEKVEYDCLVTESWAGKSGVTGFSINYFNPVTGEWRQVWVSNGYSIDYTGGLTDAGSMQLNGNIFGYQSGNSSKFRGTWTPNADGTVRQLFEVHDREKDAWNVWADLLYKRMAD